jgi:hypothetical protein
MTNSLKGCDDEEEVTRALGESGPRLGNIGRLFGIVRGKNIESETKLANDDDEGCADLAPETRSNGVIVFSELRLQICIHLGI